ncbi:MAG TPA: RecX family transcriptional regulator [Acetobacteraceae bacterium]|nr:RecX family transcriptional regulator [Acetobacteraceae bacterium]
MASRRPQHDPGPPPDRATLHDAALQHLARYAATEAGLVRVLDRRIARWLRESGAEPEEAAAAYEAARAVTRELAGAGAVNDAAFAAARTQRLLRSGRSRRVVSAHLAAKGVTAEIVEQVLPDAEAELAAALAYARRRRLGPFRGGDPDADIAQWELGAMARAGFPRAVAERALGTDPAEAETIVSRLKQG